MIRKRIHVLLMGDRIGLRKLLWQELRMCLRVRVPRSLAHYCNRWRSDIMNSFFSLKADGDCEAKCRN